MLALYLNCECCGNKTPADSKDVMICSFECTFCRQCAEGVLKLSCPNCLGNLVERPIRPSEKLELFPASVTGK